MLDWDWCTGPNGELPFLRLIKLLRTFHERPEVSALVHHVSFVACRTTTRDSIDEQYVSNPNYRKILCNHPTVKNSAHSVIRLAKSPRQEFWKKALNEGNPHAYAALLISQMSSFQTLDLDATFVYYDGYPGLMMTHAILGSPPGVMSDFAWLESVDYGENCTFLHLNTPTDLLPLLHTALDECEQSQFVGWFFLPALRELEMWVQSPCLAADIEKATAVQPSNLARLRFLSLKQTRPNTENINALLQQTITLRHLILTVQYDNCLELLQSVAGMEPGLRALSGTLKRLMIYPSSPQFNTGGAFTENQVELKLPSDLIKSFED
jgi:hypothetical protein